MLQRFEIINSESRRPDADHIIFCDGSGGRLFRSESDLELSHWRPNQTPAEYLAGTSTEICFRFLDQPRPGTWTVAVNNHLDVDGILSVYVLIHGNHSVAHRQTVIAAAEMGDFWGWGELFAQRVFQGITQLMRQRPDIDPRQVYAEAFEWIPKWIDGSDSAVADIEESLTPLHTGVELVETGQISRSLIDDRCAHYVIPASVVQNEIERALHVPGFNELISDRAILWPQVRARWDSERVCVVSVEGKGAWFHGLWFPGYLWAHTAGLWTPPGIQFHDGMESYDFDLPPLTEALAELQRLESSSGRWALSSPTFPFHQELQSLFPLVGRFSGEQGEWAASDLQPDQVAACLKDVFG